MKYIKSILEFKYMGWDEYVKKVFNAERVKPNQKIGLIYHGTSVTKAFKILKSGEIKTANEVNKYSDKTPWYMNLQSEKFSKTLQDIKYGDFVFASKMNPYKDDFYGAIDSSIVFILDGDKLLEHYEMFHNPNIEGGVFLIKGNVPLSKEFIKEIDYDPYYIKGNEEELFKLIGQRGIKTSYGFQDKSKRIEMVEESIGGDYLYHFTTNRNILNILKTDELHLNTKMSTPNLTLHKIANKPFHITFSRTPNAELGYGRMEQSRIVFNRNKIKSKYQLIPYNSYGHDSSGKNVQHLNAFKNNARQSDVNYELNMRYEYEEWLLSDKPIVKDAISYIERIDILKRDYKDNEVDDVDNNFINRIVNVCEKLGIKVYIYKNRKDMTLGRNAVPTPEYTDIGYYHSAFSENIDWVTFIAIMVFDMKYFQNNNQDGYELCKNDAIEYAEKNGIPLEEPHQVFDKMRSMMSDSRNDSIQNFANNIHNYFMSSGPGVSRLFREKILLLTKEMKRYNCRTVQELVKFKVKGLLPSTYHKKDWTDKFQLGKWKKEWHEEQGEFIPLSNDTLLKQITDKYPRFYYNPYSWTKDPDAKHYLEMVEKNQTIGNFINWLLNKYTIEKAKEMIDRSCRETDTDVNYALLEINDK